MCAYKKLVLRAFTQRTRYKIFIKHKCVRGVGFKHISFGSTDIDQYFDHVQREAAAVDYPFISIRTVSLLPSDDATVVHHGHGVSYWCLTPSQPGTVVSRRFTHQGLLIIKNKT